MPKDKMRISLRLTEEENRKLGHAAALCGLSQTEFVRQLCIGERQPKVQPGKEFWAFLEGLYNLHKAYAACIPYAPEMKKVCCEIENLILRLQEAM